MPPICTICTHLDRPAIEQAILNSKPLRRIAADFAVSESSLRRHRRTHMHQVKQTVAQVRAQQDLDSAHALVDQLRLLRSTAFSILTKAEKAEKLNVALAAVREARNTLELLLKLEGELDSGGVHITLSASPEWIEVRTAVAAALAPWPDARLAVARALLDLDLPRV